MCGAYNVINNPFIKSMTEALGVPEIESRGIRRPASNIQIINQPHGKRQLSDATWWLMLKDGKPDYRYATFNSRYDKLFSSRLTKGLFQKSRCIIPASGFIEGEGAKGKRFYHHLEPTKGALALGGICKYYNIDNQIITTASVITCPGNDQLENIHKKSIPLMLDYNDHDLINAWLNHELTQSESFSHLLTNRMTTELKATPILGAYKLEPKGDSISIHAE